MEGRKLNTQPYFNTLVESGTHNRPDSLSKALVSGEGTNLKNNSSLKNRAKRKIISRNMILALIDVVKEKGEHERIQSYWNSYHCLNNVTLSDGKMYGKYCQNRFCTICSAIRKADTINRYYPTLSKWDDPHFVTLTVKACKEEKLKRWIYGMKRAFELIHNRCKKRYQRGKGIKLIGIKSLECNFNPQRKTYNPHFHIIVPNKEIAELLKKEWLIQWRAKDKKEYRYKFVSPKAQDIKKADSLEHSLIEIIKYGSKIFTEPDLKKKSQKTIPPMIYAKALDNILTAMKGRRIFERFGFQLPDQPRRENTQRFVEDFETYIFPSDGNDWVNPDTGEFLTGYLQPHKLTYLLNNCIDTALH